MIYDINFDPKTNMGSITPRRSLGAALLTLLIPALLIFENALELLGYFVSSVAHVFDPSVMIERHAWMADKAAYESALHRLCFLGAAALGLILLGGLRLYSARQRVRVSHYRDIRVGGTDGAAVEDASSGAVLSDAIRSAPK